MAVLATDPRGRTTGVARPVLVRLGCAIPDRTHVAQRRVEHLSVGDRAGGALGEAGTSVADRAWCHSGAGALGGTCSKRVLGLGRSREPIASGRAEVRRHGLRSRAWHRWRSYEPLLPSLTFPIALYSGRHTSG